MSEAAHLTDRKTAHNPDDLARLFVEFANAGDVDGLVSLYTPDAVVAFPPGQLTTGRDAIRSLYVKMLETAPQFKLGDQLPTVRNGDIALTASRAADEAGARAQVAVRQPDGTWLRALDRPDFRA
jgi:uncharacterized protein (TIGR02246 family)